MIHTKTILPTKTRFFDFHKMSTENQKTEVQRRFEMLIKHLNISVYALAQRIGVSQTRIWRALEKQKGVDADLMQLISRKYPELNFDWVVTGRGAILNDMNTAEVRENMHLLMPSSNIKVVYAHQQADYGAHCLDNSWIRNLAFAPTGITEPGIFRDFEMTGNQMQDPNGNGILQGDIVRCQKIAQEQWAKVIIPGQIAVIVTQTEVHIRMIKANKKENITLKSWNPIYDTTDIPHSQIVEIWLYRSLSTNRDWKHKLHE